MQATRTSRLIPLGLLGLALLAHPAPAQVPPAQLVQVNGLDLGGLGFGGAQGRVVFGDPVGDFSGAMFYVVDGEVLWSPVPYALTGAGPLTSTPTPAVDLAVVRAPVRPLDLLYVTDAAGLSVATLNTGGADFDVQQVPGAGVWAGATQLRTRDLGTGPLLAGVLADGKTVRVSQVTPQGETLVSSLSIPLPVLGFDLIDFNGNGTADVAVVTSVGMIVFKFTGGVLRRELVPVASGGVVTFGSQDGERLAFWFEDPTTGLAVLRVVDAGGSEPDLALSAKPPGSPAAVDVLPSFATRGDLDADGNQDLFLQLHHAFGLVLLNQDAAGAHFGLAASEHVTLPLTSTPAAPLAPGSGRAFFGDIDSTPGDDLIVPLDGEDRVEVRTQLTQITPLPVPGGGTQTLESSGLVAEESTYYYDAAAGEARMNMALVIPQEFLPGGSLGLTHLQIRTWFQDGQTHEFLVGGEEHTLHPLNAQVPGGEPHQFVTVTAQEGQVILANTFWPEEDSMWVMFRFVEVEELGGAPHIRRGTRYSAGVYALRTEDSVSWNLSAYLLEFISSMNPGPQVLLGEQEFPFPAGTGSDGGGYVGSWIPLDAAAMIGNHDFPPAQIAPVPLGYY